MNKKIKVLQKHINKARKEGYDEICCPVALALMDSGYKLALVLAPNFFNKNLTVDGQKYRYPKSVKKFVRDFDHKKKVKPFTFILKQC